MSPSGTHSHLLEATSYLRMEVTRPFQVVCGDHWPGSQNVTFCLCEVIMVVSPGDYNGIAGLEGTGLGPSAWHLFLKTG